MQFESFYFTLDLSPLEYHQVRALELGTKALAQLAAVEALHPSKPLAISGSTGTIERFEDDMKSVLQLVTDLSAKCINNFVLILHFSLCHGGAPRSRL